MSKETDGFIKNQITGEDQGNEDSQSFRASFKYTGENYNGLTWIVLNQMN